MSNLKQSDVQALFQAYKTLGQSIVAQCVDHGQVTDFDVTALNTACSAFKTATTAIGITTT
jgi:hypothetical protein